MFPSTTRSDSDGEISSPDTKSSNVSPSSSLLDRCLDEDAPAEEDGVGTAVARVRRMDEGLERLCRSTPDFRIVAREFGLTFEACSMPRVIMILVGR